ncbi:transposon Ty3-G Gag-Pol polyprotein [Elysia marginata]|uniref:Transposon Ty3-G Gag-Pol polyprotein n=1 Tax=Elysia marginata TaxID=1093978 RepID=A0AAV4JD96_9GAST|nr:transposon Ty3-G Gag-Pol polyprotein [Elysia marginata]
MWPGLSNASWMEYCATCLSPLCILMTYWLLAIRPRSTLNIFNSCSHCFLPKYRDINKAKCIFCADELDFLGHHVSADGITPLAERVVALRDSRAPQNRTSRFLGMINYYHRFLPGIFPILAPLYAQASGKGQNKEWTKEFEEAFDSAKEVLSKAVFLHHPQPDAPTSLTVDTSNTAVGAQLEQSQGRSWVYRLYSPPESYQTLRKNTVLLIVNYWHPTAP